MVFGSKVIMFVVIWKLQLGKIGSWGFKKEKIIRSNQRLASYDFRECKLRLWKESFGEAAALKNASCGFGALSCQLRVQHGSVFWSMEKKIYMKGVLGFWEKIKDFQERKKTTQDWRRRLHQFKISRVFLLFFFLYDFIYCFIFIFHDV